MATVKLRFSALPEHVRTARLVAAAVARRAGVDESVLDEVRLAVGEACSRAVGLHRQSRPDEPVSVTLSLEDGRFSVEVSDCVPAPLAPAVPDLTGPDLTLPDHGGTAPLPGSHAMIPAPSASPDAVDASAVAASGDLDEEFSGSMGLAVISGLVDDLDVRSGSVGAVIRMSWPIPAGDGPAGDGLAGDGPAPNSA